MIGPFYPNKPGSSVEGVFRIPADTTTSALAFEVCGLPDGDPNAYVVAWQQVLHSLASGKARLRLQLFVPGATNDFYRSEFPLGLSGAGGEYGAHEMGANYMYAGDLRRKCPLFFLTGIKPLGLYSDFDLQGNATITYSYQRDLAALNHGKLLPDREYRVLLTVLDATTATNRFQLLLYSAHDSR